jgi:2-polyprenyl-3-methyl-5-hydroxy-6-metoxy-1,4-benzoquinol methylase
MLTPERFNEMANAVNHHLKGIEHVEGLLRESQTYLEEMRSFREEQYLAEIREVKQEIRALTEILQARGDISRGYLYENSYAAMKEKVDSEEWPLAIKPELICDTDEKEEINAQSVLDVVVAEYFKDLKFLDYGCGRGHVAAAAAKREAKLSVGYDVRPEWRNVKSDWHYDPPKSLKLTTNFEEVKQNAPYDVILAYDVLDHSVIDPLVSLTQIRELTLPTSRVYIRTHPWCSRHGGHLYLQKNKAYMHLIFDEIELERLAGLNSPEIIHILTPLPTYRDWFKKTGYNVKLETPHINPADDFFFNSPTN